LDAALGIADTRGLDGLSVRALARALGVTPMAIYNHVRDKAGLFDGIFERAVSLYQPTAHDEADPEAWLLETFSRVRRAMREHPALVSLVGRWIAAGPGRLSMDLTEQSLVRLRAAGLSAPDAVEAYFDLLAYTMGRGQLEAATRVHRLSDGVSSEEMLRRYRLQFEAIDLARFPTVVAHAQELATAWEVDRFVVGLRRLLRALGISCRLPSE
jgi:AcrR family transcriptional regulator